MESTDSTDIPTPAPDSDHSDVNHDSAEAMRSVWMALHSNDPSSSEPTPQAIQDEPSDVSPRRERPICRLAVISSGVLSKGRTHAIIEPHDVVKVGRDKQPEPLLRLKELAVSKHHASIFWDDERLEWAIVDLGSVHGTWLSSQDLAGGSNEQAEGQRLSAPRTASMPRRLLHGDTLTIGSSKFSVHIHDSGEPCPGCGVGPANAIPLLPDSTENPVTSRTASTITSAASNPPRVSHKAAMQSLRQTLLQPGRRSAPPSQEPTPTRGASTYQDRSRKRREMFGTDGGGTEESSSSQPTPREKRPRYDDPRVSAVLGPETPIDEATSTSSNQTRPIDESNIGHRLLMKKGWTPGETLGLAGGDSRRALLEPLQVVKREGQSGLGSR